MPCFHCSGIQMEGCSTQRSSRRQLTLRWFRTRLMDNTHNILDHSVVVSVLHVRAVPTDITASPVSSSLCVTRSTCRPQRKLHSRGCLREFVLAGSRVVCLVTELCAQNCTIHRPADIIRLPVNSVSVNSRFGVGSAKVFLVRVY